MDDHIKFNVIRPYTLEGERYHLLNDRISTALGPHARLEIRPPSRLYATLLSRTMLNSVARSSSQVKRFNFYDLRSILDKNLPTTKNTVIEASVGKVCLMGGNGNHYIAACLESPELDDEQNALKNTLYRLAGLNFGQTYIPHISLAKFERNFNPQVLTDVAQIIGDSIELKPVEFKRHKK